MNRVGGWVQDREVHRPARHPSTVRRGRGRLSEGGRRDTDQRALVCGHVTWCPRLLPRALHWPPHPSHCAAVPTTHLPACRSPPQGGLPWPPASK